MYVCVCVGAVREVEGGAVGLFEDVCMREDQIRRTGAEKGRCMRLDKKMQVSPGCVCVCVCLALWAFLCG